MRTCKSIYINYYNSLRFVANKRKKIQKGHSFWKIKDHESGRKPHFFLCFSSPNCLGNSFFHLKIVKIRFHGVLPWAYSGLQNTWTLEIKAVRLGLCPVWFRKYTHWGHWKTRFYCFYRVENEFQIFKVISWFVVQHCAKKAIKSTHKQWP